MRRVLDLEPHDAIPALLHRLRNPLAALKSGVTLVMHVARPCGEARDLLNAMAGEVDRMDRTALDTQRYARLTPGHPEPVQISEAAEAARAARCDESVQAGVEVVVEGEADLRALVDRGQLRYAVAELVANAVRATPHGGRVRIGWHRDGSELLAVEVEDSGEGVPESLADEVGKPYFSTSPERTGLGLATVGRICRLAGGRLEWENSARGGALFSMWLPVG